MVSWRFWKSDEEPPIDLEASRKEVREAEQSMVVTVRKTEEAREVAQRLRILRQDNHFREKVEAALFGHEL